MHEVQTPERIEVLIRQFPFLRQFVDEWNGYGENHRLHIHVDRMDERLMFYKPEVLAMNSGSYWTRMEGDAVAGYSKANAYVIMNNDLYNTHSCWTWDEREVYTVRSMLMPYTHRLDNVAYLVQVQDTFWHALVQASGLSPFGELRSAERRITVHRPPQQRKGGLKGLYESASFDRHAQLSTRQFIDGVIKNQPEYIGVSGQIDRLIEQFVSVAYNQGLRSRIDRSQSRGMSGMFGDVKLMTYVMAGRVMLTFNRKKTSVSLLASEDGAPCMGLQSLSGTFPEVRDVIQTVIDVFLNRDSLMMMPYDNLKDDKKVSIG
ncbi:MAG: hypothetical protein JWN64_129 [Parcubacteria group bacterium]|nr:hypothetical protein [Parcubacteria group bacterium]